jgi:hypothetical protein
MKTLEAQVCDESSDMNDSSISNGEDPMDTERKELSHAMISSKLTKLFGEAIVKAFEGESDKLSRPNYYTCTRIISDG